jgi:hypothetical protein
MSAMRVWAVPFCAALTAALCAHLGIDALGDRLLRHDTYDGVAHGSRWIVAGAAGAIMAACVAAAFAGAVREARGSVERLRAALLSRVALPAWTFYGAVVMLALIALCGMEASDALVAGGPAQDLRQLFGGSLALGAATTSISALLCALAARLLVRAMAGVGRELVRALDVAFARFRAASPSPCFAPRVRARALAATRVAGRRLRGRAPPPFALV